MTLKVGNAALPPRSDREAAELRAEIARLQGMLDRQAGTAASPLPSDMSDGGTGELATIAVADDNGVRALDDGGLLDNSFFLRSLLDSSTDYAIVALNLNELVTVWNKGAELLMGWTEEEILGRTAHVFFTDEDVAANIPEQEMRNAVDTGHARDERWHVRKDGSRFWASGMMTPLLSAAGDHVGYLKVLRDRTLQRRTEEVLERQNGLLQSVMDHVSESVFQLDDAGDIIFANPAAAKTFGWANDDLIGRNLHDLLHHHHPDGSVYPASDCPLSQAVRGGDPVVRREDVFFHKDGRALSVVCSNLPVWTGERLTGAVLTVSDVTEAHLMQRELRRSEERWRGLFQGMQEGFFIGELLRDEGGRPTDFRIVEMNPAFVQQTGLPADSVGKTMRALVPGIPQSVIDQHASVVETGTPQTFELLVPQLARWFEMRTNREAPGFFACLFRDITERKAAERRRVALVELGDMLRDESDPTRMAYGSAEILGRTLEITRAGYGTVDAARENLLIDRDWNASGSGSIAGTHHFRDYGSFVDDLQKGRVVALTDVATDPRSMRMSDAFRALGIRALANLPLVERGQFVAVFFLHHDQPRVWTEAELGFVRNVTERVRAAVERVRAEERQHLLHQELSHRLKNTLAMVQAIAAQTLRNAPSLEAARDALMNRMIALGKAHDLLLQGTREAADMRQLISAGLDLHRQAGRDRFRLTGPPFLVGSRAALSLALMVHELATNAVKYGALSVPEGYVTVDWEAEPAGSSPHIQLRWQEHDGPPVTPPTRKGFGSRMIERGLAGQIGGRVTTTYEPTGVVCLLEAPMAAFVEEELHPGRTIQPLDN